jgi:anti-sigma regulatory factor (Ser/Thr protein kinase)
MATPEGNSRRSWPDPWRGEEGTGRRAGPRGTVGGARATVLGSLTIPGQPEQVSAARAFVAQTLSAHRPGTDADAATLLTSEIVTNAIVHTKSGVEGGTVTIVVTGIPRGVLVEIIDGGSAGTPVVKGDLYATDGHGLFLVQNLAAQWGYLREPAGTTVWFHLPAADEPHQALRQAGPQAVPRAVPDAIPQVLKPAGPQAVPRPIPGGIPRAIPLAEWAV